MNTRLSIVLFFLVVMPAAAAVTPRRKPTLTPTPGPPSAYERMLEKEATDRAAYEAEKKTWLAALLVHAQCEFDEGVWQLQGISGGHSYEQIQEHSRNMGATIQRCGEAKSKSDDHHLNDLKRALDADVFWLTSNDPPKGVRAYQPPATPAPPAPTTGPTAPTAASGPCGWVFDPEYRPCPDPVTSPRPSASFSR